MMSKVEIWREYVKENRRGMQEAIRHKVSKKKIVELIAISITCEKTGSRNGTQSIVGIEEGEKRRKVRRVGRNVAGNRQ